MALPASGWSQTSFDVQPRYAYLGSFSAQQPGNSNVNSGITTLSISSVDAWQVTATLIQPARRLSDNLELPLDRVRQLFPDLAPLCNYLPVRLDYGSGDRQTQTVSFGWDVVETRVEQYLDEADPPGRYRFAVRLELDGREGTVLAPAVTVVTEFDILPMTEVEVVSAGWMVEVDPPGQMAESDPYFVRVRSNCAWSLDAAWGGDLKCLSGDHQLDCRRISWQAESGDEWQSLIPAYSPVSRSDITVARGSAPAPFTMTEVEVPLQIRVDTDRGTVAGSYTTDVRFAIHTDVSAAR